MNSAVFILRLGWRNLKQDTSRRNNVTIKRWQNILFLSDAGILPAIESYDENGYLHDP